MVMASVTRLSWIHPSCRDLVIEELAGEPTLQAKFLEKMSLQGIKLSISDSGGATGGRQLPLMKDPKNWEILSRRCLAIVDEGLQGDVSDLLRALTSAASAASGSERRGHLSKIITSVCDEVCKKWDKSKTLIQADTLLAYCEASVLATRFSPIPELDASWESLTAMMKSELDRGEDAYLLEPGGLVEWARFAEVVRDNEPRFLRAIGFANKCYADIIRLIFIIDSEIEADLLLDSASECGSEADRIESLNDVVEMLVELILVQLVH